MAKRMWLALSAAPIALLGCQSSKDEGLSSDPPSKVTKVASGGFTSPTDAVASPDGKTFYFAAYDAEKDPAIFSTPSEVTETPNAATALVMGAPLDLPIGLVMSCDGETIYVADAGGDGGAVLSLPSGGGALSALPTDGIVRPGGLAMGPDCKTLFATGRTTSGAPALFAISIEGGTPRTVYSGAPLVSPTGLHVDNDGVAWVMDHLAYGADGEGVLFAIPSDGSAATEVASNLRMGSPGGVSLTAGGGTAVMPTRDEDGHAQLTSVVIETGEKQQLATPDISDPGGLRTARKASVFAVVDTEGGAIYRAE
jgi:DNA-binding beta-propeller fold protein YncE